MANRIDLSPPELKPCPLCGKEAKFYEKCSHHEQGALEITLGIRCTKCGLITDSFFCEHNVLKMWFNRSGEVTVLDPRQEMADKWNRRVKGE